MLNSWSDYFLEFLWRMAKSYRKVFAHALWFEWLPYGVGVVVWFAVFLQSVTRIQSRAWYIIVPIFIASLIAGMVATLAVQFLQSTILKLVGKPDAMKGWDEEPPMPPTIDREDLY